MTTEKSSLLIYGADNAGKLLHAKLVEYGMSPVGFVDPQIIGRINHVPVYSPVNCPDLFKNLPLLIANPDQADAVSKLEKVLIQNGWKPDNILTLPKFYLYTKEKGLYFPAVFWAGMISVPHPPRKGVLI